MQRDIDTKHNDKWIRDRVSMCTIERESEREREDTKRRDSGTECVE